jgi:hypothetical protein
MIRMSRLCHQSVQYIKCDLGFLFQNIVRHPNQSIGKKINNLYSERLIPEQQEKKTSTEIHELRSPLPNDLEPVTARSHQTSKTPFGQDSVVP